MLVLQVRNFGERSGPLTTNAPERTFQLASHHDERNTHLTNSPQVGSPPRWPKYSSQVLEVCYN